MKMMKFLNKMDIPMLEYVFGTGKCIKILIDTKNHDFDEKTLEAQLTLLIILEAKIQLVEAWGGGFSTPLPHVKKIESLSQS